MIAGILASYIFIIFLLIYFLNKVLQKNTKINILLISDVFMVSSIIGLAIDSFPLELYEWGYISQKYVVTLILASLWLGLRANFLIYIFKIYDLSKNKLFKKIVKDIKKKNA